MNITVFNGDSIISEIVTKSIPGIVIGAVLALINHCFWESQERQERFHTRLEQKVDIYSGISEALTKLIANHNDIVRLNKNKNCSEKCEISKQTAQTRTKTLLAQLSLYMAKTNIFFNEKDLLQKLQKQLSDLDDSSSTFINLDSPIIGTMNDLLTALSTNIRDEIK